MTHLVHTRYLRRESLNPGSILRVLSFIQGLGRKMARERSGALGSEAFEVQRSDSGEQA